MTGEITTIARMKSKTEKEGQVRLLQNIAHWRLRPNVQWSQLCTVYAVIMRDLENEVIGWSSDFSNYQHMLVHRPYAPNTTKNQTTSWFCKQYQNRKDALENPHTRLTGGPKKSG